MSEAVQSPAYDPNWVLNALANGLVVLDKQQCVITWNHWIEQHSGISKDLIIGTKLTEYCSETQGSRLAMAIHAAIEHRMSSLISPALHHPVLKLYQAAKDRIHDRRMQQLIHGSQISERETPHI